MGTDASAIGLPLVSFEAGEQALEGGAPGWECWFWGGGRLESGDTFQPLLVGLPGPLRGEDPEGSQWSRRGESVK